MSDLTLMTAPTIDYVAHWFERGRAVNPRIIEDPDEPGVYLLRFECLAQGGQWVSVDSWPLPAISEDQAGRLLERLGIF